MEKREAERKTLEESPKILVAGIGAIGGLLAGMLGRRYADSLYLLARGKRADSLREKGLVLKSEFYGDGVVHPKAVVEEASGIGTMDYVLICCKNYSIDVIAEQVRPAVGKNTVVVPVMNGVEPDDRIREKFPESIGIDSLIYTVTSAEPDFSIRQVGNYSKIYIGAKTGTERAVDGAKRLQSLLVSVGFDARYTEEIESEIWQKYILNCGFNTVTARYLTDSGTIRRMPAWQEDLHALMLEAEKVGRAEGVALPEGIGDKKFGYVMDIQPDSATSSLRRDVEAEHPTELDAFLGALLRKAEKHGIEIPVSKRYYQELSGMIARYENKE